MQQLLTSRRGYIISSRCFASSGFRWEAEQVRQQHQPGPATMATGRTSPFPLWGKEGYVCNRDVPIQSVTFDIRRTDRRIGIPTKVPQELPALCNKPPVPPCLRTVGQGKHRECRSLLFPKTHSVRLLDNTGKAYPFTGRSYVEKYIWTNPIGLYYIWI